jgi:hypothetical protein
MFRPTKSRTILSRRADCRRTAQDPLISREDNCGDIANPKR